MTCKNCQGTLIDTQNFCATCGAKMIRNRLTFKNLWAEFVENVWNIDNTLFRTFRTLSTRPEEVINGYIQGLRKKYVNVFSYYALALTFAGIQLFVLRKWYPEAFDLTVLVSNDEVIQDTNVDWVYDYYSILALLNLPFYALISKFTFIGLKKYNYVEHLVINTYLIAQFTILNFFLLTGLVLLGVNYYVGGNILGLLLFVYMSYSYKRLFPLSWKQLLLRILWFFAILAIVMLFFGLIQFAALYLSGDLETVIQDAQNVTQ